MNKLELKKETLLALSNEDKENIAAGGRTITICVPTVCQYRDCTATNAYC